MNLRARPLATVIALALALWLASTLGLVHRVLHAPAGIAPAVSAVLAVSAQRTSMPSASPPTGATAASSDAFLRGGLMALFGSHKEADCRLYDQLAGGAATLAVPLVVLPVTLPAATFAYFQGEFLARWVALFDARGPPSTR